MVLFIQLVAKQCDESGTNFYDSLKLALFALPSFTAAKTSILQERSK